MEHVQHNTMTCVQYASYCTLSHYYFLLINYTRTLELIRREVPVKLELIGSYCTLKSFDARVKLTSVGGRQMTHDQKGTLMG